MANGLDIEQLSEENLRLRDWAHASDAEVVRLRALLAGRDEAGIKPPDDDAYNALVANSKALVARLEAAGFKLGRIKKLRLDD